MVTLERVDAHRTASYLPDKRRYAKTPAKGQTYIKKIKKAPEVC